MNDISVNNLVFFKWDNNFYEIISLISNSFNNVLFIFSISKQCNLSNKIISKNLLIYSNVFVLFNLFIIILNFFTTQKNNTYVNRFLLYKSIDDLETYKHSNLLMYISKIYSISNIINQYLICLFSYFIIINNGIKKSTFKKFFKIKIKHYISSFVICIISFIISLFFIIYEINPFVIIIITQCFIGCFVNYFIPIILSIKNSGISVLSIRTIFKIIITYIIIVSYLASLFNNLLFNKFNIDKIKKH